MVVAVCSGCRAPLCGTSDHSICSTWRILNTGAPSRYKYTQHFSHRHRHTKLHCGVSLSVKHKVYLQLLLPYVCVCVTQSNEDERGLDFRRVDYESLSKRSWMDVLLQIYKVKNIYLSLYFFTARFFVFMYSWKWLDTFLSILISHHCN